MREIQYGTIVQVQFGPSGPPTFLAEYLSGPAGPGDTIKVVDEHGAELHLNGNYSDFSFLYAVREAYIEEYWADREASEREHAKEEARIAEVVANA